MDSAKLCFSKECPCCPKPASDIFNNQLCLRHQTQFGSHEDFVNQEALVTTKQFGVEEFLVWLVRGAHPKFMWRRMTDANRTHVIEGLWKMVVERQLDKRWAEPDSEAELIQTNVSMIVEFVMEDFRMPRHIVDWATRQGKYANLPAAQRRPPTHHVSDMDECGKCGAKQWLPFCGGAPTCKACKKRHRNWGKAGFCAAQADRELRGKVTKQCGYCGTHRRFPIGNSAKQRCLNADCPGKQHTRWLDPDSGATANWATLSEATSTSQQHTPRASRTQPCLTHCRRPSPPNDEPRAGCRLRHLVSTYRGGMGARAWAKPGGAKAWA